MHHETGRIWTKKKYPLFMFQYSGLGSQQVSNSWDGGNGLWFNHLVQKGYNRSLCRWSWNRL